MKKILLLLVLQIVAFMAIQAQTITNFTLERVPYIGPASEAKFTLSSDVDYADVTKIIIDWNDGSAMSIYTSTDNNIPVYGDPIIHYYPYLTSWSLMYGATIYIELNNELIISKTASIKDAEYGEITLDIDVDYENEFCFFDAEADEKQFVINSFNGHTIKGYHTNFNENISVNTATFEAFPSGENSFSYGLGLPAGEYQIAIWYAVSVDIIVDGVVQSQDLYDFIQTYTYTVYESPDASFDMTEIGNSVYCSMSDQATIDNPDITKDWEFLTAEGTVIGTASGNNASYTFPNTTQNYAIRLTTTNTSLPAEINCETHTTTQNVTYTYDLISEFSGGGCTHAASLGNSTGSIFLQNNSVGADSYQWTLTSCTGEVFTSAEANPLMESFISVNDELPLEPEDLACGSVEVTLAAIHTYMVGDVETYDNDNLTQNINLSSGPVANIMVSDYCHGEDVQLQNASSSNATNFNWTVNAPDESLFTTSQQHSPLLTDLPSAGIYNVNLIAQNNCGSHSADASFKLDVPITATLSFPPDLPADHVYCEDDDITFICKVEPAPPVAEPGETEEVYSYILNLGNGMNPEGVINHAGAEFSLTDMYYPMSGTYYTTLNISNGECTSSDSEILTINAAPFVNVLAQGSTDLCPGEHVTLIADIVNYNPNDDYSYVWYNDSGQELGQSPTLSVSESGIYRVLVTGDCGTDEKLSPVITVHPNPIVNIVSTTEATCNSVADGTAEISVDPVNSAIAWPEYTEIVGTTTTSANNLSSGINYVTVTAGNGCSVNQELNIGAHAIDFQTNIVPIPCDLDPMGTISISNVVLAGLSTGFTYEWYDQDLNYLDPANLTDATITISGDETELSTTIPGNYKLKIMHESGCERYIDNLIIGMPSLVANVSNLEVDCGATTTQASAIVSFVPSSYTANITSYTWNYEDGTPFNTDNITSVDVPTGIYTLEVVDENGCEGSQTFEVTLAKPFVVRPTITHVACFGDQTGSVALNHEGVAPFTYTWANEATPDSEISTASELTSVGIGTYLVTVTDDNDCQAEATATITQPTEMIFSLDRMAHECENPLITDCHSCCELNVNGGGGVPPYEYHWFLNYTPETEDTLASPTGTYGYNLDAGDYTVFVVDNHGCFKELGPETIDPYTRQVEITYRFTEPEFEHEPVGAKDDDVLVVMNDGVSAMDDQLNDCVQAKQDEFDADTKDLCYNPEVVNDRLEITSRMGYDHYTLYYYDRAGNLVKTIPPAGVDVIDVLDRSVTPEHRMATKYYYDGYNNLVKQTTPDAGTSHFVYNELGQLRFSQNAQQKIDAAFSYTKYDNLGRIIESGECTNITAAIQSYLDGTMYIENNADLAIQNSNRAFPETDTRFITRMVYSENAGVNYFGREQRFLRNRISYTFTDKDGLLSTESDRVTTYYSYDPQGNVEWLIQDLPGFTKNYVGYEYELISGNVLKVKYNELRPDRFFHKYEYDADHRLVAVYTSNDGEIWDQDARYQHYTHGALERTVLGHDKVQGLDYIYTAHGWLKAINHPDYEPEFDPGRDDGVAVPADEFGMSLGYYQGDFNAKNPDGNPSSYNTTEDYGHEDLFNGNISSWASRLPVYTGMELEGKTIGRDFSYDHINRLTSSNIYVDPDNNDMSNLQAVANAAYQTKYVYDANGNITELKRNAIGQGSEAANELDNILYYYEEDAEGNPIHNRLKSITDKATSAIDGTLNDIRGEINYSYDEIGNLVQILDPSNVNGRVKTTIEWNTYGKIDRMINYDQYNHELNIIEMDYDAAGNRIAKSVSIPEAEEESYKLFYMRDARGNILANYKREIETIESGLLYDEGYRFNIVFRLNEVPIYGSNRIGMFVPVDQEIYSVPVYSLDDIASVDFEINGLSNDDGLYNWIAPRMADLQHFEDTVCDCMLDHFEFQEQADNTYLLSDNSRIMNFMGQSGNNLAMVEDEHSNVLFYVLTAKNYLGYENVTLILDENGHLMKGSEDIAVDAKAQSMILKRVGSPHKYDVVSVDQFKKARFSTIDLSLQGFGTNADYKGEVISKNVEVYEGANSGRHMAAIEDEVLGKNYLYLTHYVQPLAGEDLGRTHIMVYELDAEYHLENKAPSLLASIEGKDVYGEGELQISPDGHKLLYINRKQEVGNFDFKDAELVVLNLSANHTEVLPDGISYIETGVAIYGKASGDFSKGAKDAVLNYRTLTQGTQQNPGNTFFTTSTVNLVNQTVSYFGGIEAKSDVRHGKDLRVYLPGKDGSVLKTLSFDANVATLENVTSTETHNGLNYNFTGTLPGQVLKIRSMVEDNTVAYREYGHKKYELKDHLGNVRVVVGDALLAKDNQFNDAHPILVADVKHASDYYPFGWEMPGRPKANNLTEDGGYRFGFNGMEKDDEMYGLAGTSYDFGARIYDSRIAKFLSVDAFANKYPGQTPYRFADNNGIYYIDHNGNFGLKYHAILTLTAYVSTLSSPEVINMVNDIVKRYKLASDWVAFSASMKEKYGDDALYTLGILSGATVVADGLEAGKPETHFDAMPNIGKIDEAWAKLNAKIAKFEIDDEDFFNGVEYGKIMHQIQDFYAHSNYIELYVEYYKAENGGKLPNPVNIPIYQDGLKDKKFREEYLDKRLVTGNFEIVPYLISKPLAILKVNGKDRFHHDQIAKDGLTPSPYYNGGTEKSVMSNLFSMEFDPWSFNYRFHFSSAFIVAGKHAAAVAKDIEKKKE